MSTTVTIFGGRVQVEHQEGLAKAAGRWDTGSLVRELQARLTDWQGLLEDLAGLRGLPFRKLLVGRLILSPKVEGKALYYEFSGQASYGKLLAGIIGVKALVPPR